MINATRPNLCGNFVLLITIIFRFRRGTCDPTNPRHLTVRRIDYTQGSRLNCADLRLAPRAIYPDSDQSIGASRVSLPSIQSRY
ncbi:hypothetical protein BDW74DRAFT_78133 [Aspergillus multicolor]|uniref:uncharacterized protein n=1 Tax=Aspergillus multicolor TaxID=41759 RepID=UPI003CCCA96E